MEKKEIKGMSTLGILSVFLIAQAAFIVNPALSGFAKQYPDVPYSAILMISTLPSLLIVPASLFSGAVAGKKLSYRTMCLLSCVLTLISGIVPFFIRSFPVIIASRIVFGIGNGLSMPLGNALIMRLINKDKVAGLLGAGTLMQNLTGVIIQNIAGIVCAANINATWLCHLFLAIPLLLVLFFLPEPNTEDEKQPEKTAPKQRLPLFVYLMSAAYGLGFAVYYPLLLNMSSIIEQEGLGTAALAGTILSMYTIGGMLSGALFGLFYKLCKNKTLGISLILWVAFLALGYLASNVILLMISALITGFAIFTVWSAAMIDFNNYVPSEQVTAASGVWVAMLNIGSFLSSIYAGLVASIAKNDDPRLPVLVGAVISAVLFTAWLLGKRKLDKTKA